jgi:hypothetical protein
MLKFLTNRESILIEPDTSISGERVARVLDRIAEYRPLPKMIRVDHGPELTSLALDAWAYARGVKLAFIQPGKPTQSAFIESFNGRVRDERLNDHWFLTLQRSTCPVEAWRKDYSSARPHSSLGNITPAELRLNVNLQPRILLHDIANFCFNTATICSTENRFFFMANSPPFKVKFAEKLTSCPVLKFPKQITITNLLRVLQDKLR